MYTSKTDWPDLFRYLNTHGWGVERLEDGATELLLFEAFYAGMDALVDWVREDDPDGDKWDPGYLSRGTALRKFNEWREGNKQ